MGKEKGNKFRSKHSSNPQSSSSIGIDKRFTKENKASKINLRALSVPTIAPTFGVSHAYPNGPAFPSATALKASCSWADGQGEKMVCRDQLPGYIFMCNGRTKADCYRYRVFGLPAAKMEVVEKIKPQMKLFLFDFDLKLLHGIYIAASTGELGIEPTAFGGKFSAQVRFEIFKDCLPLPESAFKQAIIDNYQRGSKFKQELSAEQVTNLISLFRPIVMSTPLAVTHSMSPPGFEKWSRPAAALSVPYDQYLEGRHLIQDGPDRHSQPVQQTAMPFSHVPHASAGKIHPMHLPSGAAQPPSDPYYLAEAHQVYRPQNPFLPPQDPYSRYAVMPRDSEVLPTTNVPAQAYGIAQPRFSITLHGHARLPSSTRTAAYWAAVASEATKEVYPTSCQSMPSGSTGPGLPLVTSEEAAPTQLTVAENIDRELLMELGAANNSKQNLPAAATDAPVHAYTIAPLQVQGPPLPEPVHFPSSSSTAGYWTAMASVDPNQMYSGHYQWQPSASTGLGAENVPISTAEAGSAEIPQGGTIYDSYKYSAVPAHDQEAYQRLYGSTHLDSSVQAHDHTAHQRLYGSTHLDSAEQAHDQAAYHHLYGSTRLPSAVQAYDQATYQHLYGSNHLASAVQLHDQVSYEHLCGSTHLASAVQAHDQAAYQHLYGSIHLAASSEAAACWTVMPSQDPNQLSSVPHQILQSGHSSLGGEHEAASLAGGAATT